MAARFDLNADILKKQVVVETYRSSGPGGQRKNKTETAVRLRHLPSGVTVIATEHRSQAENRRLAFERLGRRLAKLNQRKKRRIATAIPPGAIQRMKEGKRIVAAKKRLRRKIDRTPE
jgi:peptide chain release factor